MNSRLGGLIGLLIAVAAGPALGQTELCYAVADGATPGPQHDSGPDRLIRVAPNATGAALVGATGTFRMEAVAYDYGSNRLYGADGSTLGTLNLTTGAFTPIGTATTCQSPNGPVGLDDFDSMNFNPVTGQLWVIETDGTTSNFLQTREYLMRLDPTTGQVVDGACIEITHNEPVLARLVDIDDMVFDREGRLFATLYRGAGRQDRLVEIDRFTGVARDVGPMGINDVEGLHLDPLDRLLGSTGLRSQVPNSLVTLSRATGAATLVGAARSLEVPTGSGSVTTDIEGLACIIEPGVPAIDLEKTTNGEDADDPPGPTVAVGATVTWRYDVTNVGEVRLNSVAVSDSEGVTVDCPVDALQAGQSMTCVATGLAVAGQYANTGAVTAVDPQTGQQVADSDDSHYVGVESGVDIEKATNGLDADDMPGPTVAVGSAVTWTYVVTNAGSTELNSIAVTDDQGLTVACPVDALAPGQSFTCTASGTAAVGQYANVGSVTAQPVDGMGAPLGSTVSDTDPSHYFGAESGVDIEKATNGDDADQPPGPTLAVGANVTWTYRVTNVGNTTLASIDVTDDQGVTVACPQTTLGSGASMACTASSTASLGQYANVGTVIAQPVDAGGSPIGGTVSDSDPSHYLGVRSGVAIEKATNGNDADLPPGPTVAVGSTVDWTYVVTNVGTTTLSGVDVSDDHGVAVSCPATLLAAGDSFVCAASGTAVAGQYANTGTVVAQPVTELGDPLGVPISDSDPSHYFGAEAGIDIEKATNGDDADLPPGPTIAVGGTVDWTYVVTNVGNQTLSSIAVVDDQGLTVTCPPGDLAPGASLTCTAGGTAATGQYRNLGTATAQPVDGGGSPVGPPVSDSDPSHYLGVASGVDIEKATNGIDADVAPGPTIEPDAPVTWTYVVTNVGTNALSQIAVTDDQGVSVTCPMTDLAPGANMTCTASGFARVGQYRNLGTVIGQPVDGGGVPIGPPVTDSDPSHYLGAGGNVDIEKLTNSVDADSPTGPEIVVGQPVTWTFFVTNSGDLALSNVQVSDNLLGPICSVGLLPVGVTTTCEASGTAVAGQYTNTGSVVAQPVDSGGAPVGASVSDSDPSHYFGVASGIDLEKATNGEDADEQPGPQIVVGGEVTWTYVLTNIGSTRLTGLVVTDDRLGNVICPQTALDPGASMTCSATGSATEGQYSNVADASGQPVDGGGSPAGGPVSDADPSHYFGVMDGGLPAVDIEKATNGADADAPPGATVAPGAPITWTYLVTNTGQVALTNLVVTDDIEGQVCVTPTLAAGASFRCELGGAAMEGIYANIATVTAESAGGDVSDSDPSHYTGATAGPPGGPPARPVPTLRVWALALLVLLTLLTAGRTGGPSSIRTRDG